MRPRRLILKWMLQHASLDRIFHALADPTRRAMVERLGAGPASVSELAAPFDVTLSAIVQHVGLLEESGLVRTAKVGRVRTVELVPDAVAAAEQWFASHRALWARRFDRLADVLAAPDAGGGAAPPQPPRRKR